MTSMISALIAGLLFGIGMIVAGMTEPQKVIAFLDLAGNWDPSLALVMAAAIAVGLISFTIARKRSHALNGEPMQLPTNSNIDKRLIIGSSLFGIGWGLAGYCPGPAIVSLSSGYHQTFIFVAAMLAGIFLFDRVTSRK